MTMLLLKIIFILFMLFCMAYILGTALVQGIEFGQEWFEKPYQECYPYRNLKSSEVPVRCLKYI